MEHRKESTISLNSEHMALFQRCQFFGSFDMLPISTSEAKRWVILCTVHVLKSLIIVCASSRLEMSLLESSMARSRIFVIKF